MVNEKNKEGINFLLKLDALVARQDSDGLVDMAGEAIARSHDGRTFLQRKDRDLTLNPTVIKLKAIVGNSNALNNLDLSTNDRLYMIMNRYIGLEVVKSGKMTPEKALDKFCRQLAEKDPILYGAEMRRHDAVDISVLRKLRGNYFGA